LLEQPKNEALQTDQHLRETFLKSGGTGGDVGHRRKARRKPAGALRRAACFLASSPSARPPRAEVCVDVAWNSAEDSESQDLTN
jgi:hypothetical protein